MRGKVTGILLAAAGVLLLLRELGWSVSESVSNWEFLLLIAGMTVLLVSLKKPGHPRLTIWGGILTGLGAHAWGLNRVAGWPDHWSLVPAIIGASFLLFGGILRKNRSQGTIGALLLLLGFFAWPGVANIPGLAGAAETLNTYWPLILVLLGLMLLIRK